MLHKISRILPSSKNTLQRESSSSSDLKFRSGDIIRGTVIKKFPEGEILVSARGKEFRAYTGLNLMEGTSHQFQVKNRGSDIELKVLDSLIQKLDSPLQLWASNRSARSELTEILSELIRYQDIKGLPEGIAQKLNSLQQLFPAVIYGEHSRDKAQWFARFFTPSVLLKIILSSASIKSISVFRSSVFSDRDERYLKISSLICNLLLW